MKIVMLGAPGAGKGTAAVKLAEKYGIVHISTGDIFRDNLRNQTQLGLEAKKYMDEGKLVPDEITVDMLLTRIGESDCQAGFILDGFPRTIAQAQALKKALSQQNSRVDHALNIVVSDDVVMQRLGGRISCPKCGAVYHVTGNPPKTPGRCDRCGTDLIQRDDDKPETIKKRLEAYYAQSSPLVDFYEEEGVLSNFDGNQDQAFVFKEMTEVLG